MKIIPLLNFGIIPIEGRENMLKACLDIHEVGYEVVSGSWTLILRENSILDELYDHLCAFLDIPEPKKDAFREEVSNLSPKEDERIKKFLEGPPSNGLSSYTASLRGIPKKN